MNRFRAAIIPVTFYTSFRFLGELSYWIMLIQSRLTLIPQQVIKYIRNFLDPSLNTNLATLRHNLWCFNISNTSVKIQHVLHLFTLDYHVVNIYFHCFTDLQPGHPCNHSLVSRPGILQTKRHYHIVVIALWRDEAQIVEEAQQKRKWKEKEIRMVKASQ